MKQLFVILCLSIVAISCETKPKTNVKTKEIGFTKEGKLTITKANGNVAATIDVEFAETNYEREAGLMYRSSMEENQGMLFIFSEEFPRNFYMKNTYIPLDIIYLDADKKIVSFQENAIPLDETGLPSTVPAKYVLEVNAGLAEKWLLDIGDIISYTKTK